jgi:hypothetical protein
VSVTPVILILVRVLLRVQIETHPAIETVWPTSAVGWLGIAMATISFLAVVWTAWKKPAQQAALEVEGKLTVKLDKMAVTMAAMSAENARCNVEFKEGLERERRDCAERLEDIRNSFANRDEKMHEMELNWAQSREDRRHLSQSLMELRDSITRWREEDRARDDRMLEAMVKLRGTGPG